MTQPLLARPAGRDAMSVSGASARSRAICPLAGDRLLPLLFLETRQSGSLSRFGGKATNASAPSSPDLLKLRERSSCARLVVASLSQLGLRLATRWRDASRRR